MFDTRFLKLPAAVILALFAFGCGGDSELIIDDGAGPDGQLSSELAYPGVAGEVDFGAFQMGEQLEWLEYEVIDGERVFEGDIILPEPLTPEQLVALRDEDGSHSQELAARTSSWRWPSGIIYYKIASNVPYPQRVKDAIAHWNSNTKLSLRARTTQSNYVTFRAGSGCSSSVGRQGGEQFINLSSGCSKGNIIHEIGHAAGFWHTQSRADRGTYVNIHWTNIQEGKEHNFKTYTARGYSGQDVGSYRTNSIMHYGSFSFAINTSKPTISRKDGTTFSAQRTGLTSADIYSIHKYYGL